MQLVCNSCIMCGTLQFACNSNDIVESSCKPISSQLHNVRPLATGLQLDSDVKLIII
jgi:hypothetical protein